MKYQKPTEIKGIGEWWWTEDIDGIRVMHQPCHKGVTCGVDIAFFSWAMIRGAVARKKASKR
jgi:hypothetical protein